MTPPIPPPSDADVQRARDFLGPVLESLESCGDDECDEEDQATLVDGLSAQFAAVRAPLEARIAELEAERSYWGQKIMTESQTYRCPACGYTLLFKKGYALRDGTPPHVPCPACGR
jgi:rubrerythrin